MSKKGGNKNKKRAAKPVMENKGPKKKNPVPLAPGAEPRAST